MANVNLKNIRKTYYKTEVVHGVDLDIHSGEFMVFVGPSGCGKSTLLRMIAGLEEITEGEISIGGDNEITAKLDVSSSVRLNQDVNLGWVSENTHFFNNTGISIR